MDLKLCLFVLRFYSPVNQTGSCQARSAYSSKWFTSIVHFLSPETDNRLSWISKRQRITGENISWSISMKECCWSGRGQTSWSPVRFASKWVTFAGLKLCSSMLSKNSADDIWKYFNVFYKKIHWHFMQIVSFSGKNKKNIKLLSAEIAPRVVMVKLKINHEFKQSEPLPTKSGNIK